MLKKVTITTALFTVGIITSLGYSSLAQTSQPAPTPPDRTAPLPDRSTPLPNRPSSSTSGQLSALDQQFIVDAAQGGMAEVELGRLALQKSQNPDVQRFARQMIQDHTRVNAQLMQLAAQKGVTPPPTAGPKYEAARMQLMQLSGASFDQAYMGEGGLNSHLENTAVFQREASLGQDPDLKAFARRILPAVQGHLQMAEAMTGNRSALNTPAPNMPNMQMPK